MKPTKPLHINIIKIITFVLLQMIKVYIENFNYAFALHIHYWKHKKKLY